MSKIFYAQTNQHNIKYKYRVKVTRNIKEAIKFDSDNGNILWKDTIGKETSQIKYFQIIRTLKIGYKAPDDQTSVPVNMWFDVKFHLKKNPQLVEGENMTGSRDKDAYCGVVNNDTFSPSLFLGKINDLEVASADFGNAYLHVSTKDNIYTMKGPDSG